MLIPWRVFSENNGFLFRWVAMMICQDLSNVPCLGAYTKQPFRNSGFRALKLSKFAAASDSESEVTWFDKLKNLPSLKLTASSRLKMDG